MKAIQTRFLPATKTKGPRVRAKAQGKSVDGLKQAMLAAIKTKLDQAVKDSRLTTGERDRILAKVTADLDKLWTEHNQATDGTTMIKAEYLEVHAIRD